MCIRDSFLAWADLTASCKDALISRFMLKPLYLGKRQLPVMHMHGAELCAAVQCRQGLARIEQTSLVESRFHAKKLAQFQRLELLTHAVQLFHTHAVLASDGAAYRYTQLQNALTEGLGLF